MIFSKLKSASNWLTDFRTPRVGFEPTTLRLTAECSTAELSRTTFIIINTLHIFCKCFFHFLCTLKTTYKFKSLLHPFFLTLSYLLGYALDRLVTVSSVHYCTSTSALSKMCIRDSIYTIGGVIYALKVPLFNSRHKNFGSHEIFHIFVMLGSACHFIVMYFFVAPLPV